jgi:MerR family mercuric resistance operon transcriptional regulator
MLKEGALDGVTIGQAARAVDVNVETIRYYHRIGLLPLPPRAHGSIRRYSIDSIQRLSFIRRAQQLGFSLEEIADLLQLEKTRSCSDARHIAEAKLADVGRKIADLSGIQNYLNTLVRRCKSGKTADCPIFEALLPLL